MFAAHAPTPDPASLATVCTALGDKAEETARIGPWRSGSFAVLADSGCLAGFLPVDAGGTAASEAARLAACTAIAERCLTTALVLSQWAAACRIIASGDAPTRTAWLPPLVRGVTRTTVGISQLTTSRRHLGTEALVASHDADGWRLDGVCPWVTGADSVDTIVTGAAAGDDGRRFFVVATDAAGLVIEPPLEMLALSGSRTAAVRCSGVRPAAVIAPREADSARTGGLATTALAVGAARASVTIIAREARGRPDLGPIAEHLRAEAEGIVLRMHAAAREGIEPAARDRLRADANSLVMRAAQAALVACKGAGFVVGHPAERLVREAMFFLVWSCPQAVTHAVMCDLAGGV